MIILGIETSCDETSVAIVFDGRKILSNVISSSQSLHQRTGGIIPEIASREQVKHLLPVLDKALKCLNLTLDNIDAIAITIGPGLIGSLLVGVEAAKTLALICKKPLIPVNHIFAHLYANWLSVTPPQFPSIGLIVSGGHTELFFIKDHNEMKWIGGTKDDAAGECFDKTARLLGLGYPGGPAIAAEAAKFDPDQIGTKLKITLPRPMINSHDFNFSFSGLKTAVLREVYKLKVHQQFNDLAIQQLAFEIQESITDVLVAKTITTAKEFKVKSLLIGGGVAANKRLKEKFQNSLSNSQLITRNPQLFIPSPALCTDSAAYIASYAYFHNHPIPWQKIQASPNLEVEV